MRARIEAVFRSRRSLELVTPMMNSLSSRSDDLLVGVVDLPQHFVAIGSNPDGVPYVVRIPARIVDALESLAQALTPGAADHAKVRIAFVDAHHLLALQRASLVDDQVDGQPDRNIRFERGVDRDECTLGRRA